MDLYETLGISKDADLKEIKKSHRDLAKKHHPDKGGDENEFKKIQKAFDVLSNPDSRRRYDNGEDYDGVKSDLDTAKDYVFNLFNSAISGFGFVPDHSDLFKKIRLEINETRLQLDNELEKNEIELIQRKAILERLKSPEFLRRRAESIVVEVENTIKHINKQIEINNIMSELIKEGVYEFEEDIEPLAEEQSMSARQAIFDNINKGTFSWI